MRTIHAILTRRTILLLTTAIIGFIIVALKKFNPRELKFNLEEAKKLPDSQLNETQWGYESMVFPRASMISDEYKMPKFEKNRYLTKPFGIKNTGDWSQDGQSLIIDQLLNGLKDGFYVEVGADDGENYSNSLFFEVFRHWKGILIEPNPESFAKMVQLNRKSMMLQSCVSPKNISAPFTFVINPFEGHSLNFLGGISEFLEFSQDGIIQAKYEQHFAKGDLYKPVVERIRCSSLTDLLPEDIKKIDYLSLDTEGSELPILKTIDFTIMDIRIISVDVSSITGNRRDSGLEEFLNSQGYEKIVSLVHDDIFMKKT